MDSGIRQHKRMAMGEDISDGGNFDVAPLSSHAGRNHPDRMSTPHKRGLKEGRRSAPPPLMRGDGMHGAQANPDHGPH